MTVALVGQISIAYKGGANQHSIQNPKAQAMVLRFSLRPETAKFPS